jgi:hypothetical protein
MARADIDGMRPIVLLLALAAVPLLAQGPPSNPGPPGGGAPFTPPATATVNVDCAAGQKLVDALATPAGALTVVFTGTCVEDVVIRRSDVTLRGGAPGATIDGSSTTAPNTLFIEGALRVTLADFAIRNSASSGLVARFSFVDATNLTITDNVLAGALVDGCTVRFTNATISRNLVGVAAEGGNALVAFIGTTTIADNAQDGISSSDGAYVYQRPTAGSNLTISGSECGIYVSQNAQFHASRDSITVSQNEYGIAGGRGAIIDVLSLTLTGNRYGVLLSDASFRAAGSFSNNTTAIEAQLGSKVDLYRGRGSLTTITGNRVGISADAQSQIILRDTSVTGNLERDIRLAFGSTLSRYQNTTVGALSCDSTTLIRPPMTCVATFAPTPEPEIALHRRGREARARIRERE